MTIQARAISRREGRRGVTKLAYVATSARSARRVHDADLESADPMLEGAMAEHGDASAATLAATGTSEAIRLERDRFEQRVRELEEANQRIAELNADLERRVEEVTTELQAAVERLEELDDLKSRFLSIASHELRTPVTAVSGFAQLALRDMREKLGGPDVGAQDADHQRLMRQLTIIHDQSAKLGRLVHELLDVSRIQAGRLEFDMVRVDLGDMARAVVEQAQMTSMQHQYDVRVDGAVVPMGDRDHLEQVIANLVDNAVKYSPEGGPVRVRVWRDGEEARLTVEDEGIGILPEQAGRIFELFFRTPEAEARRTPGIGLGLYITRGIVERHGGRIWAETGAGKCTRVHVSLPMDSASPRTDAARSRAEATA